ncbi:Scr1 family TA system antitoxin-like transcriptional regulator [Streptomyces sp. NPDC051041]|uniref:Scr1 family TA system antitoxin-like transcriptional regulator n=1 Tax=Streptomyces sp. NPDC051041 TaxID=3365640 RepID=UPI0037B14DD7
MANASRMAAWELFGTEPKRRRENAGLARAGPGARVFAPGGRIGHFEQAIRKPRVDAAQRIDGIQQTDGIFERLRRKPIVDRRYADYFAPTAKPERLAVRIGEFAPALIPGPLRTDTYARAATAAMNPCAPDGSAEDEVSGRPERADVLEDAARPVHRVFLREDVPRIPVGGPAVTAGRSQHVAAPARERTVSARALPYAAGRPPA